MKCSFKKIIRISDIVFAAVIIAVAVLGLLFFGMGDAKTVVVTKNGSVIAEMSLYEDAVFDAGSNIIEIKDGEVFMRDADCENRICVKTGRISLANQSIVCAPFGICVTVTGEGDIDAFAR